MEEMKNDYSNVKKKDCLNLNLKKKMGCFVTVLYRSIITDKYLDSLGLNERQKKAVKYIEKHSRITSAEYEKLCFVSERTANRELNDLVDKKVIEQKRKGPETHYIVSRRDMVRYTKKTRKIIL